MKEARAHCPSIQQAKLIAISGKQYVGKDVLADLLLEYLPDFQKVPLALAIKLAYAQQQHLTLAEIEANKAAHRPGLIELGNWGRNQDPDYWIKQVLQKPGKKLISDLRLKREYELLKTEGAFLIRLEADRSVRAQRGQIVSEADPTEQDLDAIAEWHLKLQNNGSVDELRNALEKALET